MRGVLGSGKNTILITTALALGLLVLTLGSGSAQEVSSPSCEDEICYLNIFDWADPRDPPPESGPYLPQDLTVRPGATAVWRNLGSDTHTVTSGKLLLKEELLMRFLIRNLCLREKSLAIDSTKKGHSGITAEFTRG